jgi:hypothetical protein
MENRPNHTGKRNLQHLKNHKKGNNPKYQNKLKRRKAPGPDEIPNEVFKEMDKENREEIRKLINKWWHEEEIPEDTLRARIALILKKGDTSKLANYRPISLLNTIYKIYTSIIQNRIADKLDKHLSKTRFGFRKQQGTAEALQAVRRILDYGEQTGAEQHLILVLLDWEKAFDKLTREGLWSALHRMQVHPKIIRIIKAYTKIQNSK